MVLNSVSAFLKTRNTENELFLVGHCLARNFNVLSIVGWIIGLNISSIGALVRPFEGLSNARIDFMIRASFEETILKTLKVLARHCAIQKSTFSVFLV